ncbi:MAG: MBL fold metallo-hydrolase [Propionibacteriaceae bacterium]|jgi:L-ascorbate metabolism protein UlaG (beta-lactamase superfamily)|nr:MBL fold metallo-hydrolase [Propionibacteriaceae bacterium]
MNITHLGHAAVLLEIGDVRILLDPGNFSIRWHGLTDLDAILVTHSHPDHIDPANIDALLAANPQAKVLVEPSIPDTVNLPEAIRFSAGDTYTLGPVTIQGVGGLHAVIHRDIPRIGNVGMVVSSEGEPTFFHPGDMLDTTPEGIDVLAIPAHGPWCAMKETIDFARTIGATQGFLIHDGLINERGWALTYGRLNEMTGTRFTDLRDGRPLVV